MKIIFNDCTELAVQSVTAHGDYLSIKTVEHTPEQLRALFEDTVKTKRITVQERGQQVAIYDGYTTFYRTEEYTGKIYGITMYRPEQTPEAKVEVQAAVVLVAQIQAQTFTEEQALAVRVIYPVWDGNGVDYKAGTYLNHQDVLYKVLVDHTSQESWSPDAAPSLFAKVLVDPSGEILPWEQPDSTNAYSKGNKVTHSGKTWESLVDNNVWEPGVSGTETLWKEVTE